MLYVNFCFEGRCSLEIVISYCVCYFQYYTCVKHRYSRVNSCSTTPTTNDFICTVDASVYFKTEYLAPDVKVFSCMLFSLASTTLFPFNRPKMPLTYVVYICFDISLAKGHLGSRLETYLKINLITGN